MSVIYATWILIGRDVVAQDDFDNIVLNLYYCSEDETMFFLTYATFCMKHRNLNPDEVEKAMEKHIARTH